MAKPRYLPYGYRIVLSAGEIKIEFVGGYTVKVILQE